MNLNRMESEDDEFFRSQPEVQQQSSQASSSVNIGTPLIQLHKISQQDSDIQLQNPAEEDDDDFVREDIRFVLQNDVDFVIHSVYCGHQEILELKEIMQQESEAMGDLCINPDVRIMAKIENEAGINDIEQILDVCDAILVPRGQLGTVLPIEKISWIQKNIIKLCNYKAKPVILAS